MDRPDGRVIVLLPGPPRELYPMAHAEVFPRLRALSGVENPPSVLELKFTGIGESVGATDAATVTVAKKPVTISGVSAVNKVYDGNTTATVSGTASLSGFLVGDDVEITLEVEGMPKTVPPPMPLSPCRL